MIGSGIGGRLIPVSVVIPARTWHLAAIYEATARIEVQLPSEEVPMYTIVHHPLNVKSGEAVRLVFTVVDGAGQAVILVGAQAIYRLGRRMGEAAILERTNNNGIALMDNAATVDFDTDLLADSDGPMLGDFWGQLTIVKDNSALIVAEGPICVLPVIVE